MYRFYQKMETSYEPGPTYVDSPNQAQAAI